MDAGERSFIQKGFAVTTVEDITRAAGVAKGTFYLYFNSKEDLLAALRERFIEGCRKRIDSFAARLPAADWGRRLDAWVKGGISHYLDHVELHDLVFRGGDQQHGSMAQSPLVLELGEMIRAGAAAGAWRVESPDLVSLILVSALHGIVDHIVTRHQTDHQSVIRLSQKLVRQVVGLSAGMPRRTISHS